MLDFCFAVFSVTFGIVNVEPSLGLYTAAATRGKPLGSHGKLGDPYLGLTLHWDIRCHSMRIPFWHPARLLDPPGAPACVSVLDLWDWDGMNSAGR